MRGPGFNSRLGPKVLKGDFSFFKILGQGKLQSNPNIGETALRTLKMVSNGAGRISSSCGSVLRVHINEAKKTVWSVPALQPGPSSSHHREIL